MLDRLRRLSQLVGYGSSQKHALFALRLLLREQRGPRGVLEHLTYALVRLGGALQVLDCADLLAHVLGLRSPPVSMC